jgi:hypothetical protein
MAPTEISGRWISGRRKIRVHHRVCNGKGGWEERRQSGNPLGEFVDTDGKRYGYRLRTTSETRARLFFRHFNEASVSIKIIA